NSAPVIKEDSSETRYRAPWAMSSVVPSRPRGIALKRCCMAASGSSWPLCSMAVSMGPGWMELHQILSLACSTAVTLVKTRTAPFEALYGVIAEASRGHLVRFSLRLCRLVDNLWTMEL